jgi:hypothetical protein
MAAKPEDMIEQCDECGSTLEIGQIGLCDDHQPPDSSDTHDEDDPSPPAPRQKG